MPDSKHDNPKMDVYSGVRWSAVSKYGAEGVHVVVSLVLARLLAPEYFGLLGMAMVVTGFVKVFRNLGFSSAIIQRKKTSAELLSTLFWVNLGVCLLVAAVVVGISPAVSLMYNDPRVGPIVAVLSVNFVFAGFTMIPTALLTRQMAFNKLAVREIVAVFVNGATSITLALLGFKVWALVWGTLAGSLTRMVLINLLCPFRPRLAFDRGGLKECLGFGLNLTGFSIFNYFARNADNLIIGIFLGPVALGYYALAYKLMLMPRDAVTNVVTRVLFPAFSKMQDDDERLANAYLRVCGAIAFVTFPMMAGLAVVARPFVEVLLGDKWLPAVPVICILAPVGALQSIWGPAGQVCLAKGRADLYFRLGLAGGLLFVCSFFVGLPWGIVGVASAYALTCLVWLPTWWWFAFRLVRGLTLRRLFRAILPYALASAAITLVVPICRWALSISGTPTPLALILCIITGVVTYAAILVAVRAPAIQDVVRLLPGSLAAHVELLVPRAAR